MNDERAPLWAESSPTPGRQYGDAPAPRRDPAQVRRPRFDPRREFEASDLRARAMRLGGGTIAELKRIVFRPAPKDD